MAEVFFAGKNVEVSGSLGAGEHPRLGPGSGTYDLSRFLSLLLGLPVWCAGSGSPTVTVFDSFFRVGSLVFGGGHVILPLLETETVKPGWVNEDQFLVGYGLAQAVPGPLSTYAAYLGVILRPPLPGGWIGAALCLGAVFLPSWLLVLRPYPSGNLCVGVRQRRPLCAGLTPP